MIDVSCTLETLQEKVKIDSHMVRHVASGNVVPAAARASGTQLFGNVIGPPAQICGAGAWQMEESPALPASPIPPLPPFAPPIPALAPPIPAPAPLPATPPEPAL